MQKCSIVIDLGFGDAGKGLTTDYLASRHPDRTLVIRFSGGHQVGHTVTTDSFTHTFSNFGSGTLRGVPTFYSQHTTLFPPAIAWESKALSSYSPQLFLHPLAMVTTAYDIAYNRAVEKQRQHGSCGLGFGTTIARNREEVYFFANDLQFPWMIKQRLQSISRYYQQQLKCHADPQLTTLYEQELKDYEDEQFVASCTAIRQLFTITQLNSLLPCYQHFIFEGSQGIMLDTRHGVHPHTTWSNTTAQNALQLITENWTDQPDINIYYVTRCYQTRHGNGPMSNNEAISLQKHEHEANVENEFQGKFRVAALDAQLLSYALSCDIIYHQNFSPKRHLLITCLDQLPGFQVEKLLRELPETFTHIYGSYGPKATDVRLLKEDIIIDPVSKVGMQ